MRFEGGGRALSHVYARTAAVLAALLGLSVLLLASSSGALVPELAPSVSHGGMRIYATNSSSSSQDLCPTPATPFLGIEWSCVSVLNLAEVALMFIGLLIVWYIYRDSDQAELLGQSSEVPLTAEELERHQYARRNPSSKGSVDKAPSTEDEQEPEPEPERPVDEAIPAPKGPEGAA